MGIGIGAPGAVDEEGTLVSGAVNLGWKSFNIPEALKAYINVPVRAVNDANAAGLAEGYGAPDAGDFVYLSLSNSVGGAILNGGALYTGNHLRAGEFGHTTLIPGGRPCWCGKGGCLDGY